MKAESQLKQDIEEVILSEEHIAARVREIAAQMRDDYGRIARELGDMRQTVLEQTPPGRRKAAFEKLLEERLQDGAE